MWKPRKHIVGEIISPHGVFHVLPVMFFAVSQQVNQTSDVLLFSEKFMISPRIIQQNLLHGSALSA